MTLLVTIGSLIPLFQWINKRKSRMIIVFDEVINFYKSVDNINGFEIKYNSQPISNDMYLIRYSFIYSGEDISESAFIKKNKMLFNDSCKLLQQEILSKTSELDLFFEKTDNEISFKTHMLREGDYFVANILLESKDKLINIKDVVQASTRILNGPKILEIFDFRYLKSKTQNKWLYFFYFFSFVGLPVLSISANILDPYYMIDSENPVMMKNNIAIDRDSIFTLIDRRLSKIDSIHKKFNNYINDTTKSNIDKIEVGQAFIDTISNTNEELERERLVLNEASLAYLKYVFLRDSLKVSYNVNTISKIQKSGKVNIGNGYFVFFKREYNVNKVLRQLAILFILYAIF